MPIPKRLLMVFFRPYLRGEYAAVVNRTFVGLEFYPISILGINIGKEYAQSEFEFPFFDCEQVDCRGYDSGDFLEGKLALGAFDFVLLSRVRYTRYTNDAKNGLPEGDWQNVIRMNNGHDNLYFSEYLLGMKTKYGLFGLAKRFAKYDISQDQLDMNLLTYVNRFGDSSLLIGAGSMKSQTEDNWKDEIDGGVLVFQWFNTVLPSLKKF
jgi:hypothetical protein